MRVAILAVGTELLFGQTVNTNAVYLSQQLNDMGFDVMYHHTVGDNPGRLKDMIDLSFRDCDIVITTGGLGPTQDDLTKEILCEKFGDELVLHQPSMDHLNELFKKMKGHRITENNFKQAYMPSKSEVFANSQGSAPGCALEKDGKTAICLPGPPREMKAMFEEQVRPFLEKMSDSVICYRFIRSFGIGESEMETRILDLVDGQTDPTIATYAKECECYIRVASKRKTRAEAEAAVDEMVSEITSRMPEYVYDCDNRDLPDVVGEKLIENNISISSAESCTCGMFSARLGDIAGISSVLNRAYITYCDEAKKDVLGVSCRTLEIHTAVSCETAVEMAQGVRRLTGSDICVSVTGYTGPDGDEVGLVYISALFDEKAVPKDAFDRLENAKLKNGEFVLLEHGKEGTAVACLEIRMRDMGRERNRLYSVLHMFDVVNRILG